MPAETFWLSTSDGIRLEADLDRVPDPLAVVVVLHPHPRFGGDRHNPVVQAVRDALVAIGCGVLTFDFRGVGRSEGSPGSEDDARIDALAALEAARMAYPATPLGLCGYSFGALVAAATDAPGLAARVLIAPPLREPSAGPAAEDQAPVLIATPEYDQFCPPGRAEALVRGWSNVEFAVIDGVDHFMGAGTGAVAELVASFFSRVAGR